MYKKQAIFYNLCSWKYRWISPSSWKESAALQPRPTPVWLADTAAYMVTCDWVKNQIEWLKWSWKNPFWERRSLMTNLCNHSFMYKRQLSPLNSKILGGKKAGEGRSPNLIQVKSFVCIFLLGQNGWVFFCRLGLFI